MLINIIEKNIILIPNLYNRTISNFKYKTYFHNRRLDIAPTKMEKI